MQDGKAYRIVDWSDLYEVNSGGKKAAAGTAVADLKKRPLDYVRWKVEGHKLGAGYRAMMELAKPYGPAMDLAVFGLFGKLLELAADQGAELRGWILDNKGAAIDVAKIRYYVACEDIDVVKRGLEVLTDPAVGWVEIADFPHNLADSSQTPPGPAGTGGNQRKPAAVDLTVAGTGRDRRSLLDETETETKTETYTETETPEGPAVSDSVLPLNSRASVSKAMLDVADLLGVNSTNASDLTTIRDIFAQVKEAIDGGDMKISVLDEIKNKASMCRGKGRAVAIFVAAAKEQFGYVPVARRILRNPKKKAGAR